MTDCGCPTVPGRTITDVAQHGEWHRLVVAQGGPAGAVTATTLLTARGTTPTTPENVEPDPEVRRQNYAWLRSRAKVVLVERERTWGSS